jgi:transposase
MYICVLDAEGQIRVHRNGPATPEHFLTTVAAYREDLVVAVECIFTWYWLADLCAQEGIAFVLGHALYMKAIHGGKAKNDKIDAHKIAVLVRGGMLPMAYVYPPVMRATRDLLRRRCHFTRKRAELLAHIQNTASQDLLPTLGKIAYHGNRVGGAEQFHDPEVRKSMETNLALIDEYDRLLTELELHVTQTAKVHDVNAFYRLRSVPGIGKILALVLLYEIHAIHRFPRVQDFVSYCRLVKCAKQSDGKHYGYAGDEDRQRPFEVGVLRSGRALLAQKSGRAAVRRPPGAQARQGKGAHDLGPQARAGGILHAPPRAGLRGRQVLPRDRPRRGGRPPPNPPRRQRGRVMTHRARGHHATISRGAAIWTLPKSSGARCAGAATAAPA